MIVDTHVHVLANDEKRYPYHLSGPALAWIKDMPMPGDLLLKHMDEAGVDCAVMVQPMSAYADDNNYIADVCAQHPDRLSTVGIVDLLSPDAADKLSYWVKERNIHGVRLSAYSDASAPWLDDPRTFPVWQRAKAVGIPITIMVQVPQLARLNKMLRRFPENPVALEHLAQLDLQEGPPFASLREMFNLADCPNLSLKFSTVNLTPAEPFRPYVKDLFQRLVERFGTGRLMWGSNFPNTYDRPYAQMLAIASDVLAFLSVKEKAQILGENAARWWPTLRYRRG